MDSRNAPCRYRRVIIRGSDPFLAAVSAAPHGNGKGIAQSLETFEPTRRLRPELQMDIRFVSSLTGEDENAFAPALLKAIGAILDQLPIAYTVRIETTAAQVFQHSHSPAPEPARDAESFGRPTARPTTFSARHYS
jgi:hypothetical protein